MSVNDDIIASHALQQYGRNEIPTVKPKSFWRLAWEASCDMVLIMLTVAGVILIIIYFIQQSQTPSGLTLLH
jgi:magnesium-transporting ATPase (P-type)